MSEKRLGGIIKRDPDKIQPLYENRIYTLTGMNKAVDFWHKRWRLLPKKGVTRDGIDGIAKQMLEGTEDMDTILEQAEKLIDEALVLDPRLVRRSGWVRSEDGIDGCPALIAQGDDQPYFTRVKRKVADRSHTAPCRVVISTDSKEIKPENAAAFIAAAKLSQQFRPLDLWWQGGWFLDETDQEDGKGYAGKGHIIHVPLVQGDLDFRRLEFVLSSRHRDSASWSIMVCHALESGDRWGGGVATRSYLDDTDDFVKETGIKADAEHVAEYAARWAGLPDLWHERVTQWEAVQTWRAPADQPKYREPSAAERRASQKRWESAIKEEKKAQRKVAKNRTNEIE